MSGGAPKRGERCERQTLASIGHGQQRGTTSARWHEWDLGPSRPRARVAVCCACGHEPLREQANPAPSGARAEPPAKVGGQKSALGKPARRVGLQGRSIGSLRLAYVRQHRVLARKFIHVRWCKGGDEARGVAGAPFSALLILCQKKTRVVTDKLAGELFRDACVGAYVVGPVARATFAFGCVRVGPD